MACMMAGRVLEEEEPAPWSSARGLPVLPASKSSTSGGEAPLDLHGGPWVDFPTQRDGEKVTFPCMSFMSHATTSPVWLRKWCEVCPAWCG